DDLRAGRRRRLAAIVSPPRGVSVEGHFARLPVQQIVVFLLDPRQTLVVSVNVTDKMRGQRFVRIETLSLFLNRDAAQFVFGDRLGDGLRGLRLEFALEPDETRITRQLLQ